MNLLVCTDGKPESGRSLKLGADLALRLGAELDVITVRPEPHGAESPLPVGRPFDVSRHGELPTGMQPLFDALEALASEQVLLLPETVTIRDLSHGHQFAVKNKTDGWIRFFDHFGRFIDVLNHKIQKRGYDFIIASPPRRSGISRLLAGDAARKLALDLNASVLIARDGGLDSQVFICTDGTTASFPQFQLLKRILPAVGRPVDLIRIEGENTDKKHVSTADRFLGKITSWLENKGKKGRLHHITGEDRTRSIHEITGDDAMIMMGASLKHDVRRLLMGSLPIRVLSQTEASVLLVKLPPGG